MHLLEFFRQLLAELKPLVPSSWQVGLAMLAGLVAVARLLYSFFYPSKKFLWHYFRDQDRINRLNFIEERLAKKEFSDAFQEAVLLEERAKLIFEHLLGISAKAEIREKLKELHDKTPKEIDWKTIAAAYPYLVEEDKKVVKGRRPGDKVFLLASLSVGFILILAAAVLFTAASDIKPALTTREAILAIITGAFFMPFGLLFFYLAQPMLSAKHLQAWLQEPLSRKKSTQALRKQGYLRKIRYFVGMKLTEWGTAILPNDAPEPPEATEETGAKDVNVADSVQIETQ